jgi:hypothetical protein
MPLGSNPRMDAAVSATNQLNITRVIFFYLCLLPYIRNVGEAIESQGLDEVLEKFETVKYAGPDLGEYNELQEKTEELTREAITEHVVKKIEKHRPLIPQFERFYKEWREWVLEIEVYDRLKGFIMTNGLPPSGETPIELYGKMLESKNKAIVKKRRISLAPEELQTMLDLLLALKKIYDNAKKMAGENFSAFKEEYGAGTDVEKLLPYYIKSLRLFADHAFASFGDTNFLDSVLSGNEGDALAYQPRGKDTPEEREIWAECCFPTRLEDGLENLSTAYENLKSSKKPNSFIDIRIFKIVPPEEASAEAEED